MSHICKICDTTFDSNDAMVQHVADAHTHNESREDDECVKIEFKFPESTRITGRYVGQFGIGDTVEAIGTPDGYHVIGVISNGDCSLVLKNPNDVSFSIELNTKTDPQSIESKNLAKIRYEQNDKCIYINNEWIVTDQCIKNKFLCREAVASVNDTNDLILKVDVNQKHFNELAQNMISLMVSLRLNDGPWLEIGFKNTQLVFIAKKKNNCLN